MTPRRETSGMESQTCGRGNLDSPSMVGVFFIFGSLIFSKGCFGNISQLIGKLYKPPYLEKWS